MLVRPRAGAVSARSEYSISVSPIRMMSRSRNCRGAVNLSELTKVPLALPRSAIQNTSPRLRTSACSRDANGSSTHRSLRAERPIVIRGRFRSTTESPREGVALTIKRGIGQLSGRQGDKETRRQGDKEIFVSHLHVSMSPCLPYLRLSKILFITDLDLLGLFSLISSSSFFIAGAFRSLLCLFASRAAFLVC